jgi:hypothetical protein
LTIYAGGLGWLGWPAFLAGYFGMMTCLLTWQCWLAILDMFAPYVLCYFWLNTLAGSSE